MVAATANKSTRYFVDLDSGGFQCFRAYRTLPVAAPNAAHQFKLVAVGPVLRPDAGENALIEVIQQPFTSVKTVGLFVQRCDLAVVGILVLAKTFDLGFESFLRKRGREGRFWRYLLEAGQTLPGYLENI